MQISRIRFSLKQMMIAVAIVGISSWAYGQYRRLGFYYIKGWWEAERELWRGDATVYTGGRIELFCLDDLCAFDRDTGLVFRSVYLCKPSQDDFALIQGHNDHIAQYIRSNGLPKNSLKPWNAELVDLKQFFDRRSPIQSPKRLAAGGPWLVSPDRRNRVRLVAPAKDRASPKDSLKLVIAAGNVVLSDPYVRWGAGESDLLWGPERSRTVVVRSILGPEERFQAFDLRTGNLLREEAWRNGMRRIDYFLRKTASGAKSSVWSLPAVGVSGSSGVQ